MLYNLEWIFTQILKFLLTLSTKIYEKDNFNFLITNFLFLCSHIIASAMYGVFVSQLICYCRACSDYKDFLYICQQLTTRLILEAQPKTILRTGLKKFYGHCHILIDHYKISVLTIIDDLSPKQYLWLIFSTWIYLGQHDRKSSLFCITWFHPSMESPCCTFFIYWFCQYLD